MKTKGSRNKKGVSRIISHGYIHLFNPTHCEAMKNGYVREHRLVMADFLGRPLKDFEEVHHIDGNKQNNELSNLELMTKAEHTSLTHKGQKRVRHNSKSCRLCKTLTASRYGLFKCKKIKT